MFWFPVYFYPQQAEGPFQAPTEDAVKIVSLTLCRKLHKSSLCRILKSRKRIQMIKKKSSSINYSSKSLVERNKTTSERAGVHRKRIL